MADKIVTADLAKQVGFINDILPTSLDKSDFFDPNQIPIVPKLMATDTETLLNCKQQLMLSNDISSRLETMKRENAALKAIFLSANFNQNMRSYMMKLS